MLTFALPVHAGNIFFGLSIAGDTLTLNNQGNSTAFYPVVMRLLPDGRWEPTTPSLGVAHSAELLPGAHIDFIWPASLPHQPPFALDAFRPVMVRFFDQAGNGFGQISFFNQPAMTSDLSQTSYVDGVMTITPPRNEAGLTINSSWLLWPQEEGIGPLRSPVSFVHKQPPALHIEWKTGMAPLKLNLGAGLPSAILLHEMGGGYVQQNVINGGVQGVQQRASWLDASELFYKWADWLGVAATMLMFWYLVTAWRTRSST